jgi:HAD superfamily hydrolase (TIGR01458 family)
MAGVLLDIDGVLQVSGVAIPGAPGAVQRLREDGHLLRFVTNNTIRSRARLAAELQANGFDLDEREIETAPLAAAHLLAGQRVLALVSPAIQGDLAEAVELVDAAADAVLVGGLDETPDAGSVFDYDRLNRAFLELERGARLVCLHRNRWWLTASGPKVDAGLYVAGLEYAAHVEAELVGKPSPAYFAAALDELGVDPANATMVGDDVETDVLAAMAVGMRGVLVRTGKFREQALAAAPRRPDGVIDSVAGLADWLAARAESGA